MNSFLKRAWRSLALAGLIVLSGEAVARDCSREDSIEAETVASTLKTWKEVYSAFQRFKQCDDGAIGEGFSDSIVKLLANRWSSLPEAGARMDQDPSFRAFVLRHVDETAGERDLNRLAQLAGTQCPEQHRSLCAELRARALKREP